MMLIRDLNVSLGGIFGWFGLIGDSDGRIDAYIVKTVTFAASWSLFFTFDLHQIRSRRFLAN
jgi:hypothetical protein